MMRQTPRRVIAIGLAAAAGSAGVALAQAPATTTGDFGGGAIAVPVDEDTVAKDMLLSIRAVAGGRVGVDGQMYTNCGLATIKGRASLAADGAFTLRGAATRKPVLGVTERTTFTIAGRLTADGGGTGTAKATVRAKASKRAARTCKSAMVRWTVRRPGEAVARAPAPAPAVGTLFGLTAQSGTNAGKAVALHVTKAGRAIDRFLLAFRAPCEDRRIVVNDDVNYSPELEVAADGSFRFVERFRANFSDVAQRTTIVVRGQFDEFGAVAGKVAVTQRYSNRRTGRSVDVCKTGALAWSARP